MIFVSAATKPEKIPIVPMMKRSAWCGEWLAKRHPALNKKLQASSVFGQVSGSYSPHTLGKLRPL
jgi:hypothetical protein